MSSNGVETKYAVEELVRGFGSLLDSQEKADVTIVCGGEILKYHSQIICPQSDFFKATFWGNFVEGNTEVLDLPDDDPLFIRRMMRYFYVFDYEDKNDSNRDRFASALNLHAQMYLLGDKYSVEGLKKMAAAKFERWCHDLSSNVNFDPKTYMGYLLDVVPLVYTNSQAQALRHSLVKAIACYLNTSLSVLRNDGYKDLFFEYPEFAYDTLTASMVAAHTFDDGWTKHDEGWDPKDG